MSAEQKWPQEKAILDYYLEYGKPIEVRFNTRREARAFRMRLYRFRKAYDAELLEDSISSIEITSINPDKPELSFTGPDKSPYHVPIRECGFTDNPTGPTSIIIGASDAISVPIFDPETGRHIAGPVPQESDTEALREPEEDEKI